MIGDSESRGAFLTGILIIFATVAAERLPAPKTRDTKAFFERKGSFQSNKGRGGGRDADKGGSREAEMIGGRAAEKMNGLAVKPYPVDLLTADTLEVGTIRGVGPVLAAEIIRAVRKGEIRVYGDLMSVRGVGPARLETLVAATWIPPEKGLITSQRCVGRTTSISGISKQN